MREGWTSRRGSTQGEQGCKGRREGGGKEGGREIQYM